MRFKNQLIQDLVKNVTSYGNLVINDITDIKVEKARTDGKVSRKYYVAYPQSLDNITAARGVTMFQSHNGDGSSAIWKSVPNPARVRKVVEAGDDFALPGYVCNVELNASFKIGDNDSSKTTLYVSSMEVLEKELETFLVGVALIEEAITAD